MTHRNKVFPLHCVGPRDWTQVVSLGNECRHSWVTSLALDRDTWNGGVTVWHVPRKLLAQCVCLHKILIDYYWFCTRQWFIKVSLMAPRLLSLCLQFHYTAKTVRGCRKPFQIRNHSRQAFSVLELTLLWVAFSLVPSIIIFRYFVNPLIC